MVLLVEPVVDVLESVRVPSVVLWLASLKVHERGKSLDLEARSCVGIGSPINLHQVGWTFGLIGQRVLGSQHQAFDFGAFSTFWCCEHHEYVVLISDEIIESRIVEL